MPRRSSEAGIERHLKEAVERVDPSCVHHLYWEQNEFIHLEEFIPVPVVERCLREMKQLDGEIHRNDVPGHKQGGSVSFCSIREKAPDILAVYWSRTLRAFFSRLVDAPLEWCPEDDPHSCVLDCYTKPGDHIGFHYDASCSEIARYTVLMGLVEESERCRLVARVHKGPALNEISETRIPLRPGTLVIFNGGKLWHAVTPMEAHERRVVLMMQYVAGQRMGLLKKEGTCDHFAPVALMH